MSATDINISFGANTAGIQQALSDIRQSVNQYSKNITSNFQTVNQTLNETRNKFATISNAINQAKNKWTDWAEKTQVIRNSFRIAQVTAQQLSAPLREFSRFEDAATRLAPLVGGLEAAKILCAQLRDEAANGTMSFEQLASVAGRLSTVFKNPADVQKWTTIFHNISAGTGLDINELIGNFTKLKAAGRVTGEFPEMFAQKGVNIFGELEKQTGKSATELRKMATAGTLSFSEIEKALEAVATGTGQFAGQAAKMSNTFGGSVGTMVANWKILLAEFAKPIAETVTPWIQNIGKLLSENKGFAKDLGAIFTKLAPAVAIFAGALAGAKMAMIAFNAVTLANPILLAVAGIATAATAIYNFLPEAKSLTDMVTKSNREWENSLKDVKRAYEDLRTDEQLAARIKQDERNLSDKEAAFREANPDFDVRRAETMQWRLEAHYRATGGGWLDDALFEKVHGYSVEEAEKQVAALLEHNAILKRKDELKSLTETTKARIEATKAKAEENAATEASIKAAQRAAEAFRALNAEQAKKAYASQLDATTVSERPDLLLAQAGFANADALEYAIAGKKMQLEWNTVNGNATEAQVSELRRLIEARESYNKLVNEAKSAEETAAAKRDAALASYERRKALLEAELSGNRELVRTLELQNKARDLAAQYEAAGMNTDEAEFRAREIIGKENALAEMKRSGTDANTGALGAGTVSSEQASVGGGRSLSIGMSGAIDVARNQLSVAQKMRDLLAQVVENTAATPNPARIL